MTTLRVHPDRYAVRQELEAMNPQRQAHLIYRTSTMLEFPWETRFGLNLAFYRPFAVPRMAALIAHTGHMAHQPRKRAMDTGLLMYELIEGGLDSPRGEQVVQALNRMHQRWSIENEDYLYVLASFVVVPSRWIDQVGWRALTEVEREATAVFYAGLGERMAITGIPVTYRGFAELFDAYEAAHVAYSTDGAAQMAATQRIIDEQLPRRLQWLGPPAISALLDRRLSDALGVKPAKPVVRRVIHALLGARAFAVRRKAPRTAGWFEPGRRVRGLYPEGYQLEQLGPATARHPG